MDIANGASTPPQVQGSIARWLAKDIIGILILLSVLVLVSGRLEWTRAWAFAGMVLAFQVVTVLWLMRLSPDLLVERSRLQKGTKVWDKYLVIGAAGIGTFAIYLVAALEARFHWPLAIPLSWTVAAFVVSAAGAALTLWAMLANRFFATTVRIQTERGHVVVDGGPYRYVRHPGYTGIIAFTLASPVALGSWRAAIPAGMAAALFILRTVLEDRTLHAELDGYRDYAGRVHSRLIPGLW